MKREKYTKLLNASYAIRDALSAVEGSAWQAIDVDAFQAAVNDLRETLVDLVKDGDVK